MTPERLFALVLAHSPGFAEPVGGGKPSWTILEAAWGASGFDNKRLAAFLWRYTRDPASGSAVYRVLWNEALQLSQRERWPTVIQGQPYLGELVKIVVAEEQMSELQRDRLLRWLKERWGDAVWDRQVAPKHRAVGAILDRYCVDAHEHIARRIRDDED